MIDTVTDTVPVVDSSVVTVDAPFQPAPFSTTTAPVVLDTFTTADELEGVLTRGESIDVNRLAATLVQQIRTIDWLASREMPRFEAERGGEQAAADIAEEAQGQRHEDEPEQERHRGSRRK